MLVALRLLFYLGVRRVYLLGCDFRMDEGKAAYAFDQDRTPIAMRNNNRTYQVLNERLAQLLPYFDKEGYCVSNCTPNSGLTVYPCISFEEAVTVTASTIPKTIDTSGMYERR